MANNSQASGTPGRRSQARYDRTTNFIVKRTMAPDDLSKSRGFATDEGASSSSPFHPALRSPVATHTSDDYCSSAQMQEYTKYLGSIQDQSSSQGNSPKPKRNGKYTRSRASPSSKDKRAYFRDAANPNMRSKDAGETSASDAHETRASGASSAFEQHDPKEYYHMQYVRTEVLPRFSQLLSPLMEDIKCENAAYKHMEDMKADPAKFNLPEDFKADHVLSLKEMEYELEAVSYGLDLKETSSKNQAIFRVLESLRTPLRHLVVRPTDFEDIAVESGRNAPEHCYFVRYKPELFRARPGLLGGQWIGKELSEESLALDFYDKLNSVSCDDPAWTMFAKGGVRRCGGITVIDCKMHESKKLERKNLLLLQNFNCGYLSFRKLDILMGTTTAISGWRGTSPIKAWKANKLAATTNTAIESFRCENFISPPDSMAQYCEEVGDEKRPAKLKFLGIPRFRIQTMTIGQIMPYFFDFRDHGNEVMKRSEEYLQVTTVRVLNSLYMLRKALGKISVPQKFIHTYLTIGFDIAVDEMRWRKTECAVHNWDQSTITTEKEFQALSEKEQKTQTKCWEEYLQAVDNIGWELMRYTYNRSLSPEWNSCVFELEDAKHGKLRAVAFMNNLDPAAHTVKWKKPSSSNKKRQMQARSSLRIYKINGNYRLELETIKNLPSNIIDLKQLVIHCVIFQHAPDGLIYYDSLKAKTKVAKLTGRVFNQPSRIINVDSENVVIKENYFFSESIISPEMLSFDEHKQLMSKNFPPHLRTQYDQPEKKIFISEI